MKEVMAKLARHDPIELVAQSLGEVIWGKNKDRVLRRPELLETISTSAPLSATIPLIIVGPLPSSALRRLTEFPTPLVGSKRLGLPSVLPGEDMAGTLLRTLGLRLIA